VAAYRAADASAQEVTEVGMLVRLVTIGVISAGGVNYQKTSLPTKFSGRDLPGWMPVCPA